MLRQVTPKRYRYPLNAIPQRFPTLHAQHRLQQKRFVHSDTRTIRPLDEHKPAHNDYLILSRLKLRCEVGFSAHEIGKLQELCVSLRITTDTQKAATSDQVSDGIDLKPLTKQILARIESKKYALIESVAHEVARIAFSMHPRDISSIEVTVEKPHAIRFSDYSAVTICRSCSDFAHQSEQEHIGIAIISIGSNIEPASNIRKALHLMSTECGDITQTSAQYMTKHVDSNGREDANEAQFINCAVELRTSLSVDQLKHKLRDIEAALGRKRDANNKFIAREIDLDVTCFESEEQELQLALNEEDLSQKHVLLPVAEIRPSQMHPSQDGVSLYEFAQRQTGLSEPLTFFARTDGEHVPPVPISITMKADAVDADAANSNSKVALITGGSSKLGQAMVRKLHCEGYNVLIHYARNRATGQQLVRELNAIRAKSAKTVASDFCDCGDDADVAAQRLIDAAYSEWHRLDVLVNNASLFDASNLESVCSRDMQRIMKQAFLVNATFPLLLTQSAMRHLEAVNGCVVNLCDVHAERPLLHHSAYCASKAALLNVTKSTAKDLAQRGIRVNGISPGAISWKEGKHSNAYREEVLQSVPLKRMGTAQHVVDALWFLVNNSYVTGQIINVDGGRSLNQ